MKLLTKLILTLVLMFGLSTMSFASSNIISKSKQEILVQTSGMNDSDYTSYVEKADSTKDVLIVAVNTKSAPFDESINYSSTYCSSGCSTGCSSGCTSGCSSGCTSGCSVGCSYGCR